MPATATKPTKPVTAKQPATSAARVCIEFPPLPTRAEVRPNERVDLAIADNALRVLNAAFAVHRGETLTPEQSAAVYAAGGDDFERRRAFTRATSQVEVVLGAFPRIGTAASRAKLNEEARAAKEKHAAAIAAKEQAEADEMKAAAEAGEAQRRVDTVEGLLNMLREDEMLPPGGAVRRDILRRWMLSSPEGERYAELMADLRELQPIADLWARYAEARQELGNAPVAHFPTTESEQSRANDANHVRRLESMIAQKAVARGVIDSVNTSSDPGRQFACAWAEEQAKAAAEVRAELDSLAPAMESASVEVRQIKDFWINLAERLAGQAGSAD